MKRCDFTTRLGGVATVWPSWTSQVLEWEMAGFQYLSLHPAHAGDGQGTHLRYRYTSALPPGAQLLRLGLLGVLEIIVGLHEEKPSTLPIADFPCLLQALFRLAPQQIDAAHKTIPPVAWILNDCSQQSWQNVGALPLETRRPP
jgi:hypothetical protein